MDLVHDLIVYYFFDELFCFCIDISYLVADPIEFLLMSVCLAAPPSIHAAFCQFLCAARTVSAISYVANRVLLNKGSDLRVVYFGDGALKFYL